jgi:arogenate/prephenate dehydratase
MGQSWACFNSVKCRDPLVSSKEDCRSKMYKTSIVFSLAEGPGNLFKALSVFALRDIDMTKIQSRPLRSSPLVVSKGSERYQLNYLFYVDVYGSLADEACQNALKHLQEIAPFLRVLGSYPADTEFFHT